MFKGEIMRILKSFLLAFSMYSIIKTPKMEIGKGDAPYVFSFFPLVGVMVGGVLYVALSLLWGQNINFLAALATLIPIILTGGMHLDGFIDTSDGLFSYGTIEKRLEILKDPHVGAFGVIAPICYFVLYFGGYSLLIDNPKFIFFTLISFFVSRILSALFCINMVCAKGSGLVYLFTSESDKKVANITSGIYLAVAVFVMLYLNYLFAGVYILVISIFCIWFKKMAMEQFGGITGDLAGFLVCCVELTGVILAGLMGVML